MHSFFWVLQRDFFDLSLVDEEIFRIDENIERFEAAGILFGAELLVVDHINGGVAFSTVLKIC